MLARKPVLLARCPRGDRSARGESSFNGKARPRGRTQPEPTLFAAAATSCYLSATARVVHNLSQSLCSERCWVLSVREPLRRDWLRRDRLRRDRRRPPARRAAMRSHIGHIGPMLLARCPRGDFSAWGEQLYRGEHDCAGSAQPAPPLREKIVLSFARAPLHNDRLRSGSATIRPGAAAAERL